MADPAFANGSTSGQTVTTTSADGQSKTVQVDHTGSGTFDTTETSQTVTDADGLSYTTLTDQNADGSTRDRSVTMTSADGLSKVTQLDLDGDGVADRVIDDATVINADGGQTETVTETSTDGTLLSQTVTIRSTDGESRRITTDADGDGAPTRLETVTVEPPNDTSIDRVSNYNPDGSLASESVSTTGPEGLSKITRIDSTGDGTFDRTIADRTVVNADGSSTETVSTRSADDTLIGQTVTTLSADSLSKTTQIDTTGNGTFDRSISDVTLDNADGSQTETVATTSADGTVLSRSTTELSTDRQTETITTDGTGDGATTRSETIVTAADGTTTDSVSNLNPDGSLVNGSVTTTSANGLSKTTAIDASGDGTFSRTTTDVTTIFAGGIRSDSVTETAANGSTIDKTVITSSANGLSTSLRVDSTGDDTFDRRNGRVASVSAFRRGVPRWSRVAGLRRNCGRGEPPGIEPITAYKRAERWLPPRNIGKASSRNSRIAEKSHLTYIA